MINVENIKKERKTFRKSLQWNKSLKDIRIVIYRFINTFKGKIGVLNFSESV